MSVTHAKVSAKSDGGDATLVLPSDWNASHTHGNENANIVFAGPASGGAAAPTFRAIVAADLPALTVFTYGRRGANGWALGGANQVRIHGFVLTERVTASAMLIRVNTQDAGASLYSVGIYNTAGSLVASIAAQQFNAELINSALAEGTVTLAPGKYYFGFTGNATTAQIDNGGATQVFTFLANTAVAESSSGGTMPASVTIPADSWNVASYGLYFALR